jgi:gamma-glutamyl-gamma-aminobutyrate hydrolase PuuD
MDMQSVEDAPISDLLEHWIAEQRQRNGLCLCKRPHIGILAARSYQRDGGWPAYSGDAPTVHAVLEAGGLPWLIPTLPLIEGYDPLQLLSDDRTFALLFELLWPVMRELDGLISTGGGDLTSCLYRKPPHPQTETPDAWRDVWERYISLLSWLLCIPTLGMCRGMQLMNVALGGTLYQDLRAQWPKDSPTLLRHRARGRVSSSNWVSHPVHLTSPDSRLAVAVRGRGTLDRPFLDAVLSMHHQAVDIVAPGFEVIATSPDGVIEAVEATCSARWWVGVQFHPEWMTHLSWALGLFTALIDACRGYSAVPRDEIETLLEEIQAWLRQHDQALDTDVAPFALAAETQSGRHCAAMMLQRNAVQGCDDSSWKKHTSSTQPSRGWTSSPC